MSLVGKKRLVISLTLWLILTVSSISWAQDLSFVEAVKHGLENSPAVIEKKEEIEDIKREFAEIEADLGWEWQISVEGRKLSENITTTSRKELAALKGERSFYPGLTIEPKVYLKEKEVQEEGLSWDKFYLGLEVEQPLYPWTSTKARRDYITEELELIEARADLEEEKKDLVENWLGDYLELIELKLEVEIEEEYLELAREQLKKIKKEEKADGAAKEDLLEARLDVNDARQAVEKIKNDYRKTKQELIWEMGLKEGKKLKVAGDVDFGVNWLNKVETRLPNLTEDKKIIQLVEEKSSELLVNELERRELEYKLKWEREDKKPELILKSAYEAGREEDKWKVALNLEQLLFDSGEYDLERKELKQDLKEIKRERKNLLWELKMEVKELIGEIKERELELIEEELELEKEKLEFKEVEKDYQAGELSSRDYKEAELDYSEEELNLIEAQHDLLLGKYELLKLFERKLKLINNR